MAKKYPSIPKTISMPVKLMCTRNSPGLTDRDHTSVLYYTASAFPCPSFVFFLFQARTRGDRLYVIFYFRLTIIRKNENKDERGEAQHGWLCLRIVMTPGVNTHIKAHTDRHKQLHKAITSVCVSVISVHGYELIFSRRQSISLLAVWVAAGEVMQSAMQLLC